MRRLAVLAALLLALAGCADEPAPAPAPMSDAGFAAMMLPHHEQALVLSALVPGRSANPQVADLAFRIDREQAEEIGQMQGLLNLRGGAPAGAAGPMAGMADAATLDRLRASSGAPFDRLWLQTMIAHHRGAVSMAQDYLAGAPGALTEFARTIERSQQAEIDRMQQVLTRV